MVLLAACREPPAREMRTVQGANVEIRAIGLPRPPEPALGAAFATVTQIDGAAADRAVTALRAAGARKGLVNLGGDHVVVFGEPLVVAVPDPTDVTRPRWASFSLSEGALGRTSAAGGPVLAVTVVARAASDADAISTAALPLPLDQALGLITARGAVGFAQTRQGTDRIVTTTPGFRESHDLRPEEGVVVRP